MAASVAHADAIHTTGHHKSRGWIAKLWPSEELVDKVRSRSRTFSLIFELTTRSCLHMNIWVSLQEGMGRMQGSNESGIGNYVIDRKTGKKIFETMPLCKIRHLLLVLEADSCARQMFEWECTSCSARVKNSSRIIGWKIFSGRRALNVSISPHKEKMSLLIYFRVEGKLYDKGGPEVLPHIQSFIQTYDLPLNELLIEDLTQYPASSLIFFGAPLSHKLTTLHGHRHSTHSLPVG